MLHPSGHTNTASPGHRSITIARHSKGPGTDVLPIPDYKGRSQDNIEADPTFSSGASGRGAPEVSVSEFHGSSVIHRWGNSSNKYHRDPLGLFVVRDHPYVKAPVAFSATLGISKSRFEGLK